MDVKKEYDILKRKYKLPDFETVDSEIELSSIKNINRKFLLRIIRHGITERLISFCRFFENLLHPTVPSLVSMHEVKYLDDKQKDKLLLIIKELMLFDREALMLELELSEQKDAKFISDFFREWPKLKGMMREIISDLHTIWEKKEDMEDNNSIG